MELSMNLNVGIESESRHANFGSMHASSPGTFVKGLLRDVVPSVKVLDERDGVLKVRSSDWR